MHRTNIPYPRGSGLLVAGSQFLSVEEISFLRGPFLGAVLQKCGLALDRVKLVGPENNDVTRILLLRAVQGRKLEVYRARLNHLEGLRERGEVNGGDGFSDEDDPNESQDGGSNGLVEEEEGEGEEEDVVQEVDSPALIMAIEKLKDEHKSMVSVLRVKANGVNETKSMEDEHDGKIVEEKEVLSDFDMPGRRLSVGGGIGDDGDDDDDDVIEMLLDDDMMLDEEEHVRGRKSSSYGGRDSEVFNAPLPRPNEIVKGIQKKKTVNRMERKKLKDSPKKFHTRNSIKQSQESVRKGKLNESRLGKNYEEKMDLIGDIGILRIDINELQSDIDELMKLKSEKEDKMNALELILARLDGENSMDLGNE